jgi:hypothetical protein
MQTCSSGSKVAWTLDRLKSSQLRLLLWFRTSSSRHLVVISAEDQEMDIAVGMGTTALLPPLALREQERLQPGEQF